jgi:twitching motility protein PilU
LSADLIEQSDFSGVQARRWNKSMAEGSQTFEQDLARLITDGTDRSRRGPGLCRLSDQPDVAAAERLCSPVSRLQTAEEAEEPDEPGRASPRSRSTCITPTSDKAPA